VSWTLTGAAFGAVIAPVSLGLYSTYFLGPLYFVTGMLGLVLVLFHDGPGYYLCLWTGLVAARTFVLGSNQWLVEVANAIIWAAVYGTIGALADRFRRRKQSL
jgi:hypothetical protein